MEEVEPCLPVFTSLLRRFSYNSLYFERSYTETFVNYSYPLGVNIVVVQFVSKSDERINVWFRAKSFR